MTEQEKQGLSEVFKTMVEIANKIQYSCSRDEGEERVKRILLLGEAFWDEKEEPFDAAIFYRKGSTDKGGTIRIVPFGASEIEVELLITGEEFLEIVKFLLKEGLHYV